jgi:hypothetical protein
MMRLVYTLTIALATTLSLGGCSSRGIGHGGNGNGGNSGNGGNGNGNGGNGGGGPTCTASGACQMQCPGGGTTTLTGKVYAPNGTLPLYNAIVYVPSTTPTPFTEGVTCDRCNGNISGNPIVQTLTDATGSFTLNNVPVGGNVPLVVQLGKWRRTVMLPSVAGCVSTPLTADSTRLPANHGEGDIPRMAIVTGNADPFECLLLKMGINASEIQNPHGTTGARIDFYRGHNNPGTIIDNSTPDGEQLYNDATVLAQFDVVMLPCEGDLYNQGMTGVQNIGEYVNKGGRVFTTHWSYDWWSYPGSPFDQIANWQGDSIDQFKSTIQAPLNVNFPKGKDFAAWLIAAGVTKSQMNHLAINEGRHNLTKIDATLAQDWINYNFRPGSTKGPAVMHLTFNTPLNAAPDDMGNKQYCGRAVYSDFHVTAGALKDGVPTNGPNGAFPDECLMDPLTDQEKALIFMLFDLSSCVQSDQQPPIS